MQVCFSLLIEIKMTMKEHRMHVLENAAGAYGLMISTFVVLIVTGYSIVVNSKTTYCCSSLRVLIGSILASSFISTMFCFLCSLSLVSLIYLGTDWTSVNTLHDCMSMTALSAQYIMSCHILLLSLHRYIGVVYPLKLCNAWVVRKTKRIVAMIWTASIVTFVPLIAIELVTKEKYKLELYLLKVQHCMNIVIILWIAFFSVRITSTLVKRFYTMKKIAANGSYRQSSAFIRSVVITLAMGIVFAMTYLPRAVEGLSSKEPRITIPIFFYVASYIIDPLLIILKDAMDKKAQRSTLCG